MPRVTQYGDVTAGNGAAVSLNGMVLAARGTIACFLDPSRVLYQRQVSPPPDERWQLEIYDIATKQSAKAPFGERGANFLAARGGRWMAYAAGLGVYDATGSIWPNAGLAATGTDGRGAIGQDGTIGFVQDYDGGHGLQLLTPSGEAIDLPDIAIQTLSIFDRTLAVWVEGGQVKAWSAAGLPQPAPQAEPVSSARVVRAGNLWFLLVTTNDRLILRPWDVPTGKVIVPTPTAFAADAVAINANTIRVVSSRTVGERPADIEMHDVAVAEIGNPVFPIDRVPGPIVNGTALTKAEITVDAFTLSPANRLPDGTVLEFHDRENAIGTRARVWVENGSARMSIDYPGAGPGLKGETGARRPVR